MRDGVPYLEAELVSEDIIVNKTYAYDSEGRRTFKDFSHDRCTWYIDLTVLLYVFPIMFGLLWVYLWALLVFPAHEPARGRTKFIGSIWI